LSTTERTLKIAIRAELQQGFQGLAKQLEQLTAAIDKSNKLREISVSTTKKADESQRSLNKSISDGIKIVEQNKSQYDKLADSIGKVRAANRANEVTNKAALQTEIKLLSDYIKKTGDLESLKRKMRDSNGRFMSPFSADALKAVNAEIKATQTLTGETKKLNAERQKGSPSTAFRTSGLDHTASKALFNGGVQDTAYARASSAYGASVAAELKRQENLVREENALYAKYVEETKKAIASVSKSNAITTTGKNQAYYTEFGKTLKADAAQENKILKEIAALDSQYRHNYQKAWETALTGYRPPNLDTKTSKMIFGGEISATQYELASKKFGEEVVAEARRESNEFFRQAWGQVRSSNLTKGVSGAIFGGGAPSQNAYAQAASAYGAASPTPANKVSAGVFQSAIAGPYSNIRTGRVVTPPLPMGSPTPGGSSAFGPFPYAFGGGAGGGGSGRGGSSIFPVPSNSVTGSLSHIYDLYTKIGHALWIIQYSTMTIFGATGISIIAKAIDSFIRMRNEVSRTGDGFQDLGANINSVFSIAKQTYGDTASVGRTFSTINTRSTALGLDRNGVENVTRGISAAFAASPGTNTEKQQAQYQFMQAISSNRLGGDELRAILEEAPYVGNILSKGVAKVRGVQGTVNLRDSKNPVNAKEIAQVFGDPKVIKEILDTIANQGRTFADVMAVGKIRLDELVRKFVEGSGVVGGFIHLLLGFLTNDKKFDNFILAIESATVALGVMAATMGVKAGGKIASGLASSLFAKNPLTGLSNGRTNLMYAAAGAENVVRGVGGALSSARTSALGAATAFAIDPAGTSKKALGDLAKMFINLGKSFGGLLLGGTAIIVIVALLAARFNYLLGKFGDGINIFDIMAGVWAKMVGVFKGIDDALGGVFSKILGFIDGILKGVINMFKGDADIRKAQFARELGAKDYKEGANKQEGILTLSNNTKVKVHYNENGELIRDANKGIRLYDLKTDKDLGKVATTPDQRQQMMLSSRQKVDLPPRTLGPDKGENPYKSLLKRIKLFNGDDVDMDINDPWYALNKQIRDKTQAIEESINQAADKLGKARVGELKSALAEAAEAFKGQKLAESIRNFYTDFNRTNNQYVRVDYENGLSDSGREVDSYQRKQLENLFNRAGMIVEGTSKTTLADITDATFNKFEGIQVTGRSGIYNNKSTPADLLKLADAMGVLSDEGKKALGPIRDFIDNIVEFRTKAFNRETDQVQEGNRLTKESNGYFGRAREEQTSFQQARMQYRDAFGNVNENDEALQNRLKAIAESYRLITEYQADWTNGAKEAFAEYLDNLKDVASATKTLFANAFRSLEDAIVGFIQTGKLSLGDFARGIVGDLTRMFVQQTIMKPIVGAVGKLFNFDTSDPSDKILDAHKKGGDIVKQSIIEGYQFAVSGDFPASKVGLFSSAFGSDPAASDPTIDPDTFVSHITDLFSESGDAGRFAKQLDDVFAKNTNGGLLGGIKQIFGGIFNVGGGIGSVLSSGLGSLVPKGLTSIIDSLFTVPGGSNILTNAAGEILPAILHAGGNVGQSTVSRLANPGLFTGAMRFHSGGYPGLAHDEVPAILQRGERVLTAQQQRALGSSSMVAPSASSVFSPTISLTYNAAPNSSQEDQQAHAKEINDLVLQSIRKEIAEYDQRSKMPGTSEYLSKRY
jgi:tape measure domain-containing protein